MTSGQRILGKPKGRTGGKLANRMKKCSSAQAGCIATTVDGDESGVVHAVVGDSAADGPASGESTEAKNISECRTKRDFLLLELIVKIDIAT